MYYYLIIALQGYCVYHCYTNRNNYYWIFAIIFLPLAGCLLYLFMNVIRKGDVEKAQENIVQSLNPTKKIRDLEKRLGFSETFDNRVALADAYMENNMFDKAIEHYKASLKDMFENDYYVLSRLQEANYQLSDIDKSLEIAERIKDNQAFLKSKANLLYAFALEKKNEMEASEKQFRLFDAPYNYYAQRLELARFLVRRGKLADAKAIYQGILDESENMSRQSYRANRVSIKLAKEEWTNL